MPLPVKVKIVEVGPRDGLQNEKEIVPPPVKIDLIDKLSASGLRYIEASSFVSPKAIPQLGDAKTVFDNITRKDGVTYAALVPNEKGMAGALECGVTEIAVFTAASESFTQKNINAGIEESFARFAPVIETAKAHNIPVRGYVSCVAGCPYEGNINPQKVAAIAARLYQMGCYEISLGDTIGVGTPNIIQAVIEECTKTIPVSALALHMHNTYGQALVNIYAGLQMGISVFDSAVGGLGGCPYAHGASGNVATEDLVYMLHGLGIETGIDLQSLVDTAWFITSHLDKTPDSKVAKAMKEIEE